MSAIIDILPNAKTDSSSGVVYWLAGLAMGSVVIFCWMVRGPDHPVFGIIVVSWTLILGPGLAIPAMRVLPRQWFRVPVSERRIHRWLGVRVFRRFLERIGWEAYVHKRTFHRSKTGLYALEVALRANASAHGVCFVFHIILASVAVITGYPWGGLWIILPGVFVHLYPVMLQRSIMLRLQPLLDKMNV